MTREGRSSFVLCVAVLGIVGLDLVGWWSHVPLLTSAMPGYATMKPNTAACLGLLAVAVLFTSSAGRVARVVGLGCAALALALSGLTLVEYVGHVNLGIDQMLAVVPRSVLDDAVGRMSVGSALCLMMVSVGLLLRDLWPVFSVVLVLVVLTVSLCGLVGFVFQAGPLVGVTWLQSLAVHTAAALAMLQVAMLLSRPEREPVGTLKQLWRSEGRTRYVLVAVTVLPVLVALPVLGGLRLRRYDAPFAMALLVVLLILLQTALLWNDSRTLNRYQRQAADTLLESEKLAAVGRLASSIAHEINNPLESVTNLLYLARQQTVVPEVQQYLDTAERELGRVAAISSQTLRFYKQSSKPRATDLTRLLEEVLAIHEPKVVLAKIEVSTRSREERTVLCFDGEVRQVVGNLIGNAVDAMAEGGGGRLLLRTRGATDWATGRRGVVMTIADTGRGIPAKVLERIFEPFFTTKGMGGTGLGLWISSEIVRRHEGRMRVRSRQGGVGSGTVFTVFLPMVVAARG